jgi:hypothetical protein
MAWVGAGEARLDRGISQEHGYSAWASQHSDQHSELRFGLIFLPVFDEMPARV